MTTRIKTTDEQGRILDPFLSFLVLTDTPIDGDGDPIGRYIDKVLREEWNAAYVIGLPSYLEFDTHKDATAFCLRWNGTTSNLK